MAGFTEKIKIIGVAPVTAATIALTGGGCAQTVEVPPPSLQTQEVLSAGVGGASYCIKSYPVSATDTPDDAQQPYIITFTCEGPNTDYKGAMTILAKAAADHGTRLPERLEIEFNAGSLNAKRVDVDPGKLLELDKELAGRVSQKKIQLMLTDSDADNISAQTPFNFRKPVMLSVPARLINTMPPEELRKDIAAAGLRGQLKRAPLSGKEWGI